MGLKRLCHYGQLFRISNSCVEHPAPSLGTERKQDQTSVARTTAHHNSLDRNAPELRQFGGAVFHRSLCVTCWIKRTPTASALLSVRWRSLRRLQRASMTRIAIWVQSASSTMLCARQWLSNASVKIASSSGFAVPGNGDILLPPSGVGRKRVLLFQASVCRKDRTTTHHSRQLRPFGGRRHGTRFCWIASPSQVPCR